jgi:excisionase family DNA binding protein
MSASDDRPAPAVETLLTADEVCALLKVKKSWLYDTVEQGLLSSIRLGKQLRFRPSAIASYLDHCETQTGTGRAAS